MTTIKRKPQNYDIFAFNNLWEHLASPTHERTLVEKEKLLFIYSRLAAVVELIRRRLSFSSRTLAPATGEREFSQ